MCTHVASNDIKLLCNNMNLVAVHKCMLHSVSNQFSDIGSLNQLSNEQKRSESEQKQSISEQTRSFVRNVPYRKLLVTRESYTDG